MVNSISSTSHVSQANDAAKPSAAKPQQSQQQKSAPQPSDTVTLKSTGSANQSGDNQ
jgi:hypothetical protein